MSDNIKFESGATTAASDKLILSVMNDGTRYETRKATVRALLAGCEPMLTIREIVLDEAAKQRRQGCKFKAAEITEAARIIQAETLQHVIESWIDEQDQSKEIEVTIRRWRDTLNGNSYFACLLAIPIKGRGYKSIIIPLSYGYGSQPEYEAINLLDKLGFIKKEEHKYNREYNVRFTDQGYMLKKQLFTSTLYL